MALPVTLTRARLGQLCYVPVLSLAMALMLLRLLLMARLLDVPAFATYSAGLLVSSSFCMLACLGLQSMLQRALPMMIVHRRERAGAVLQVQCMLVAAGCAVLAAALAAAAGVPLAGLSPALLALALLHGLSQQFFLLATVESRSRGEPLRFARQNFERSFAVLGAGALVAASAGDAALVLATEALISLVLAAGLTRRQLGAVPLALAAACRLAWRRLPALRWRSAFALLAVASLGFLTINADRWLAAQAFDTATFAQYAFAWTVLLVAQSLQVVINASLFPLLARRHAAGGRSLAFRVAARASLALAAAGVLVALPLAEVLDFAVARWFADYAPARALLPVFLVVGVLRVSDFWSSYLIIIGLESRLLVLNLASAGVAALGWWAWWRSTGQVLTPAALAALALAVTATAYAAAAVAAWRASRPDRGAAR